MKKGPILGLPRLTSVGPFVTDECEIPEGKAEVIDEISFTIGDENPATITEKQKGLVESEGFAFISDGQARAAFSFDGCVLKVSKMFEAFQTRSEIYSWNKKLTDEQKRYFAPVVSHSENNRWLTMPLAETDLTEGEHKKIVRDIIMEAGIDLTDFNEGNFGRLNGDLVCIDYGTGTTNIEDSPDWDSRKELLEYEMDKF